MNESAVPPDARSTESRKSGDRAFYLIVGAVALLLASVPYLYGAMNVPAGHLYTGLTYNIDDVAVYLAWIRQAADGQFFQSNLFTTDPQKGAMFSFFSLLLGGVARLTTLSPVAVYHVARVLFGVLLLWAVARLIGETLSEPRARRTAFVLVCFSAGLGWLFGGYDPAKAFAQPIDLWQPEAFVFLSLYYAPLFTAALALMVVFIMAVLRAERTGRLAAIWPAALTGFLLGNFHSYDVIHLFAVWLVYRLLTDALARRIDRRGWLRLVFAGLAAVPTTAYQYYALIQDPLFAGRDVGTKSESPVWTLLGYGLVFVLAVFALARRDANAFTDRSARRLLGTWAVVGLLLAYAPVDFQRKLLMGTHIPLCLLAGAALASLTARLSGDFPKIALGFGILLTVPSNVLFLLRDIDRLSANVGSTAYRPYLTVGERDALNWLRQNGKRGDGVLVSPDMTSHRRFPGFPLEPYLAVYVPASAGLPIYVGHWSETPRYGRRLDEMRQFFLQSGDEAARAQFLQENRIRYVLISNKLADGTPTDAQGNPIVYHDAPYLPVAWTRDGPPAFLKPVHQNADVTIYAVER
jgi:hypothetical protein